MLSDSANITELGPNIKSVHAEACCASSVGVGGRRAYLDFLGPVAIVEWECQIHRAQGVCHELMKANPARSAPSQKESDTAYK